MEAKVPSKEELEKMKKDLEGWRERLEVEKKRLLDEGHTEEEAQRAIEPSISYCLGKEEEIRDYEEFYRMEEGLKS